MKKFFLATICLIIHYSVKADEGMWVPFLLENNIGQMTELGLRLTADDIYNINQSCLKDAVVGFVDLDSPFQHFCSGSVISAQGLVITNHHCGLSTIQQHSSLTNNYINDGFWAEQFTDELGDNNIGICFLRQMEDVSNRVLNNISDTMSALLRNQLINSNIQAITDSVANSSGLSASVDAYYCGNEYYLSVYEIFEDVRLVGTPPISMGNFGGDTDNWMWPRHTCDFSLFRIYADSLNRPAKYSSKNIPYKPTNHLKINAMQKNEGDFVMLMGYPGTTHEYLPSFIIDATQNVIDPIVVGMRTKTINIIRKNMRDNDDIAIKYASKAASIANAWKKLQGESKGLKQNMVVNKKQEQEQLLQKIIEADSSLSQLYGNLLNNYKILFTEYSDLESSKLLLTETLMKSEMIRFALNISKIINKQEHSVIDTNEMLSSVNNFFSNYDINTDKAVSSMLIAEYIATAKKQLIPDELKRIGTPYEYIDHIASKSSILNKDKIISILTNQNSRQIARLKTDQLYKLASETGNILNEKILKPESRIEDTIDDYQRAFMRLQLQVDTARLFYPDANSTFRIAYGQIMGYKPCDATHYAPFSTLNGVMEKCDIGAYDYTMPDKLKTLHLNRDYGSYANPDGSLTTCFISTCHTTGGNSGSPALDANGNLIGINFDRVWEGTMSDLQFAPNICRNICLDIRYVLFTIDKLAGGTRLINELDIIGNNNSL